MTNAIKKISALGLAALAIGLFAFAPKAGATVMVDNLSKSIAGETGGEMVGSAISVGATKFYLTSIVAQVYGADIPSETFSIYSRNANGTLGSLLISSGSLSYVQKSATTFPALGPYPTGLLTASFSDYLLQANTSYWLVIGTPTAPYINWEYTTSTTYTKSNGVTLPSTNETFFRYQGVDSYYRLSDGPSIFQVNGDLTPPPPVPEPSSPAIGLMGLGLLGVARRVKRRST